MQSCAIAAIAVAAALLPAAARDAAAQGVFVVTSAVDKPDVAPGNGVCATSSNVCTLRAAIQEANALAGANTIGFAIGSGVQSITLSSALPTITQPLTIDGWTQPGFSGTPLVDINGAGQSGLAITAGSTTVRGLILRNFSGYAVVLTIGGGNVFAGNYVGIRANGTTPSANSGYGIVVSNSSNNRIGGTAAIQRNVISRNTATGEGGGIVLHGGGGNLVQGNFIGTDATGMVAQPNEARGIAIIGSSDNVIGGPQPGASNVIAGNRTTGVRITGASDNNVVQANLIGVNRSASGILPNDRGVQIRDGSNNKVLENLIAGNAYDGVMLWGAINTRIEGNIIAFNGYGPIADPEEAGYFGVWVLSGTGNQVVSNQIFDNYHVGINLNGDLVTPNDIADADGGANNSQNHPTIFGADRGATTTNVTGSVSSTANGTFRVQLFANPTCDSPGVGEGQHFIGETTVVTNGAGGGAFGFVFGGLLPVGWAVSGTATDSAGNTSEFAPCRNVR